MVDLLRGNLKGCRLIHMSDDDGMFVMIFKYDICVIQLMRV